MSEGLLRVSPPLSPGVYARRPAEELPFPLDDRGTAVFARARHALWQGVQALGLEPGDEILVPAYHQGSEVESLLRAGLVPRFYEAHSTLVPDADELESLLGPPVRALYVSHYLGFPQDAARWRAWCDERDLLLLEDAGQAWLASDASGPVGSLGDLAIFCLYKMIAVPDGGSLVVRGPAPRPETGRPLGLLGLTKRHGVWAAQHSHGLARIGARLRNREHYDTRKDFALGDPGAAPTSATLFLLPRLAHAQVAPRRRGNYAFLLEDLAEQVPTPFDSLPAGASPFAFPIESQNKERLLARLADRGIEAVDLWSAPHASLPASSFPGAASRRARTIILPVHQDLRPADLERIAAAVRPPHRRPRRMRLEPIASFEALGPEWDELAELSRNVFATRDWISLWWSHFGRGRRLLLTACRSPTGQLVAILPLYLAASRRVRVLRLLGHGTADLLGPVCAPEHRMDAGRALRRLLDDRTVPWDFFLGELLPGDEPWSSLLGARTIGRDGYPILRFEGRTWEEYAQSRGRRFRKGIGQAERRLARDHDVRMRLTDDPERLSSDLDTLFALHRARWTDEESPFGANERFHRLLSEQAFRNGWLHLWILEIDGQAVAAEHTFRFAEAQNHYQGGRRPDWDHASVGSLLFTHTVRDAFEAGLTDCRFLRGREEYKYRFANEDPELETVGVARGAFGDAALAAATALRRRHEVGPLRRWLAE
jgi:dTDP-4-amino-4,6-dideoxygalactose transaminase/CelD/BcsL family acetyltransferase involved in cellulose biosynthesis